MSAEKLSHDEVPHKFADWLLEMGCPAEKVPSVEKMTQMCRGQYYMVWRSLMEHVQPKDIIRHKRLQVFCDDVRICQENNVFNVGNSKVVIPEQLTVWKQHQEIKNKVSEAENRVANTRSVLNELTDKISSKLTQRNSSRRNVEDLRRRSWLLRHVANDLVVKQNNLEETRAIANSLCNVESEQSNIQGKLERCMAMVQQQNQSAISIPNPVASSSIVSPLENDNANGDKEDNLMSVVKCRGDVLWPLLYEKRSSIVSSLSMANTKHTMETVDFRTTPQSVLAHTAFLHSTLALEVMKNKIHIKHTRDRVAASVEELNNYITGEACELLVLLCEKSCAESRVKTLKILLEEITTKTGVFSTDGDKDKDGQATPKKIASIDKCIESTRDELKHLILSLAATEQKIQNIKECLEAVFKNGIVDSGFRGVQLDFPKEPLSLLRQFYTERCSKDKPNGNLSLDLDVSDCSYIPEFSEANPRFVDELRIYLKKFNLEKNRKLVLDSGDKIWIFETLQLLRSQMYSRWSNDDITPLICPSVCITQAMQNLEFLMQERDDLTHILKRVSEKETSTSSIDISSQTDHEAVITDKIKKRIAENSSLLQKTNKTLELSQENLQFWSEDSLKKYISNNRSVDGKTYRDYETFYLKNVMNSL